MRNTQARMVLHDFGLIALCVVLVSCGSNPKPFNFEDQVMIRPLGRHGKMPAGWEAYSVSLFDTKSGCSELSSTTITTTVYGNTAYSTVRPDVTCWRGQDLSTNELNDYKLLAAAVETRKRGYRAFVVFNASNEVWMATTSSEQAIRSLRQFFVPTEGESVPTMLSKSDRQARYGIGSPWVVVELATDEFYFLREADGMVILRSTLELEIDTERRRTWNMSLETEFDYDQRIAAERKTVDITVRYLELLAKASGGESIEEMFSTGRWLKKPRTYNARIPILPELYNTEIIEPILRKKYDLLE